MSKRKRDPIFAVSEKMALIDVVERHYNVVENKKIDATTMKSKIEEWKIIADEFNAMSSIHPRDWTVLKNCWENLKKRAKNENTLRNQHFLGTGGGPPKKFTEDPAIERVFKLIKGRVAGYVNSYDSDGTHILASCSTAPTQDTHNLSHTPATQEYNLLCTDDTNVSEFEVQVSGGAIEAEMSETFTVDWSHHTPTMLREPRNPILVRSPSPSPPNRQNTFQHVAPSATPRTNTTQTASATTSRKRPTLRRDSHIHSLTQERMTTIINVNKHAEEEHGIQMKILKLQEEKEKEILKQEKLKTAQEKIKLEMLQIQLRKLKE